MKTITVYKRYVVSIQKEHIWTAFLLRRSPHKKTVLCVAPSSTEQLRYILKSIFYHYNLSMSVIRIIEKYKYFIIIILFSFFCSIPFLVAAYRHSYVSGDDILTHMERVEGMLSSYKAGHIPARLHLKTFYGYAYGMGFFYPQLFLLIPLIMRICGMNFILSTNAFLLLINLFTGVSSFFCIYKITHSIEGAATGALLALFCFYRLSDLFYRGSVGETLVFIFTPFIVLGLQEIYNHIKTGPIWLVIGLSGLLFSHLFSFIFLITLLIIFLMITANKWIKNKSTRNNLLISVIVSVLITAEFWIPFLEQYFCTDIMVNNGYDAPFRQAIPLQLTFKITGYWWWKQPSYLYDPVLITYPISIITIALKNNKFKKTILILLFIGSLGFFLSSDLFPWKNFESFHRFIQFPWRFLTLPAAALPLACGISVSSLKHILFKRISVLITVFICIFTFIPILKNIISDYIYYTPGYRGIQNDIGAGDYLPLGTNIEQIKEEGKRVNFYDKESTKEINYKENGLQADLQYYSAENNTVEFPFLYYKGWYYQIGDNKPMPAKRGMNGLTEAPVPAAENGTLHMYYQKTIQQHIADIVSILGITIYIIIIKKKFSEQ